MDFRDLPTVPESERGKDGKKLYVNQTVPPADLELAKSRGWNVTHVLLIADAAERVRATIEGASIGSLLLPEEQAAFLELEAKTLGLFKNADKGNVDKPSWVEENDPDELLRSFGREPKQMPDRKRKTEPAVTETAAPTNDGPVGRISHRERRKKQ